MPSNQLIFCHPLLLPSVFLSIRVFSNESVLCIRWPKYWSFSFNISPSNKYSGLISFKFDWFDPQKNRRKEIILVEAETEKQYINNYQKSQSLFLPRLIIWWLQGETEKETEIETMRGASKLPGDWATSSEMPISGLFLPLQADFLYLQIMISFLLLMYQ